MCVCVCVCVWRCGSARLRLLSASNVLQQAGGHHTSAFASIRQHTSAYVNIRRRGIVIRQHTSAYVSIRQHTSTYLASNVLQQAWGRLLPTAGLACVACVAGVAVEPPPAVALCARPLRAPAYVSIRQRQHTSAYVSIRQHTSAYVSIRQRLHLRGAMEAARREVRVN